MRRALRICLFRTICRGRIVEQGTADEIFNNPQTPYARELIGAALN